MTIPSFKNESSNLLEEVSDATYLAIELQATSLMAPHQCDSDDRNATVIHAPRGGISLGEVKPACRYTNVKAYGVQGLCTDATRIATATP